MDDDIDAAVNDIMSQLRSTTRSTQRSSTIDENIDLTKEQLEEFTIKCLGKLVAKSLNIVDEVRDTMVAGADSKDVTAVADLINASSSAIDTLAKIYTSEEKNKTQMVIKQMDIDAKERMNVVDNQTKLLLSREEVMKAFVEENKDVIDI
jgi:DNA-binding protein